MKAILIAALILGLQCPGGVCQTPPAQAAAPATIVFDVNPADGEVWIGATRLLGRKLTTTPLAPGKRYSYEAVVKWPSGKEQRVTARFGAGETVRVPASIDSTPATSELIEGAQLEKDGSLNFGMEPATSPTVEMFAINGYTVPRFAGIQSVSQLPDDRKALRLTLIGPKEFTGPIVEDLAKPSLRDVRDRVLVQAYTPDAWAVKESGFAGGTQIYLQAPDGKVLHRSETYGGPESLVTAIRKADPTYRADRDPNLSGSDGGDSIGLIVLLAIVGFVAAKL